MWSELTIPPLNLWNMWPTKSAVRVTESHKRKQGEVYKDDMFKGFTNTECEFYPCHEGVERDFNCLFCYCPLVDKECPGPYKVFVDKYHQVKKDCTACTLPHDGIESSWKFIQMWASVSPRWDLSPQTPEHRAYWTKFVKKVFDKTDIEWADSQ